jgi:copper chaperone
MAAPTTTNHTHHGRKTALATKIELNITGMTCEHCVNAITGALKEVPGVSSAKVSLESNSATVEGDAIDPGKVIAAVAEEGYTAAVAG